MELLWSVKLMADIIIDKEIVSKDYKKYKSMGEVLFDKNFKKQIEDVKMFSPEQLRFIKDIYSIAFASGCVFGENKRKN